MPQKQYAILPGSRILVTGANSYIGSNIIDLLLELGFQVLGTIRAEKPWLNELFDAKYGKGRFSTIVIPSLDAEGVFDEVLTSVAGIVHVATDVSMNPDPDAVIPKVLAGTLNPLIAAARTSSVKRFVLTSSSSAAVIPVPDKKMVVDKETWNDFAVQAAYSNDTPVEQKPFMVYAASKTEGERAAWKFVKEKQPSFTFNTVLPNMSWGRILSSEIPGSTMGWTRDLLHGDDKVLKMFPPQWYVDVQDTARLHVVALLDPDVKEERVFAFAGPYNYTDVIGILRKLRPHLCSVIPDPPKNEGRDLCDIKESKRAEQLLKEFFGRPGWVGMEESLAEGIVDVQ